MAILGANKPLLLNQVKNDPNIPLQKLTDLLNHFEDLKPQDFKGYISDALYNQLLEAGRDPQELELWNKIQAAPTSTPAEVQDAQRLVSTYMTQYPQGTQIDKMPILMEQLERRLDELIEAEDWKKLDKESYNALQNYKENYPNSVHLSELDDLMWGITTRVISRTNIGRYLDDYPNGRHAKEANQALEEFDIWENIKYADSTDSDKKNEGNEDERLVSLLLEVAHYRSLHPNSWLKNEVNRSYNELREKVLKRMKANPSKYKKDCVDRLVDANIFTKNQLRAEELLPQDNRETPKLKDLRTFQLENPNIKAPEGCTDVYLFGTPGSGKTCLLMGLLGADGTADSNGNSYTINTKKNGGPYAAALQEYVEAGITPGRTYGSYVTTISGVVTEKSKGGNTVNHQINLVEMSGEEFAIHIAGNEKATLADMGTGATNLLRNKNRKVFFIVIDPTTLVVDFDHMVDLRDGEGNLIGQDLIHTYVNQRTVINQFASLFSLDENQDIMNYVDAIHFIVTKADMLDENKKRRLEKARDILLDKYSAPVQKLINYCEQSKRVNYSTNYRPHVFTFSLGHFYLGDIFDFNNTETLEIVDTIRSITGGTNNATWWDKFMQAIGD